MRSEALLAVLLVTASVEPAPARAQSSGRVVAVLSSDAKPYWEAFEGFQKEFGAPVTVVQLRGGGTPEVGDAEIVVAFGGRAALQDYPSAVRLVYCLSPGRNVSESRYARPPVKVHMRPPAETILSRLLELQPDLRRLAVLWGVDTQEHEVRDFRRAAGRRFEVVSVRATSSQELLERLRELPGNVDGLWLTPDPAIVDADNFSALREFSRANRIPFYCPTEGLVEKGGTASFSASYAEIGRAAAQVARAVQAGSAPGERVFPEKAQLTLSAGACAEAGLRVPVEVLRRADRVLP